MVSRIAWQGGFLVDILLRYSVVKKYMSTVVQFLAMVGGVISANGLIWFLDTRLGLTWAEFWPAVVLCFFYGLCVMAWTEVTKSKQ